MPIESNKENVCIKTSQNIVHTVVFVSKEVLLLYVSTET